MERRRDQADEDFLVGVTVGARNAVNDAGRAALMDGQNAQVAEELATLNRRLKPRNPLLVATGGALAAFLLSTAAFAIWNKIHRQDPTGEASKRIVDIRGGYSINFYEMHKLVSGSAEHDAFAYMDNPWAYGIGIVDRVVEYRPNGSLQVQAVDDPDLGFYLLVSQLKDGQTQPLEFTFDTPGDGKTDNTATIHLSTPEPDSCQLDVGDNQLKPDKNCTPLDDQNSVGLVSMNAWDGQPGFEDNGILRDGEQALEIAINNPYCELATFGAPDLTNMINNNFTGITPQSIYLGLSDEAMAAIRLNFTSQYGISLTNAVGMPTILRDADVALLKKMAKEAGKPLTQLTPDEYHKLAFTDGAFSRMQSDKAINPGPNYPREIIAAHKKNADIRLPSQTPKLTEANADTSGWLGMCLPEPGTQAATDMVNDRNRAYRISSIFELPENAMMNPDGTFYNAGQIAIDSLAALQARVK